jgi:hypothetical protein
MGNEEILKVAMSTPDGPPPGSIEIGQVRKSNITFFIYQDKDMNYYYDSDRQIKFRNELKELQKKRKKIRWQS